MCAAVSVLAQTTLLALVECVWAKKEDRIKYEIDDNRGFLNVELPIDIEKPELDKTQIVLEAFFLGIKSIIESCRVCKTRKWEV